MRAGLIQQPAGHDVVPVPGPVLQRCGGEPCACEQDEETSVLRRHSTGPGPGLAPPIVHDVLRAPGLPLDAATEASMSAHFGHDFSQVRVHTDTRAAESARAVAARAYTVGADVVFGPGEYQPGSAEGRGLLAHELTHVVQQREHAARPLPARLVVAPPGTASEHAADEARSGPVPAAAAPAVMRRLVVDAPSQLIANPTGAGVTATNARIAQQYLRELAPAAQASVDATGVVSLAADHCRERGFFERVGRGAASGYRTGTRIGATILPGAGTFLGGLIGGLIGGIAGIFGPGSAAAESATPAGGSCLCQIVNHRRTWRIVIDDRVERPVTGGGAVYVPSPNGRRWGAATRTPGQRGLAEVPPYLILAHELCGHVLSEEVLREPDHPEGDFARERRIRERENEIRREHGLPMRGMRLRDPYCGESFFRQPGDRPGTVRWPFAHGEATRTMLRQQGDPRADKTSLDDCRERREEVYGPRANRYRVDEAIPE